jgi:hypothetical protein
MKKVHHFLHIAYSALILLATLHAVPSPLYAQETGSSNRQKSNSETDQEQDGRQDKGPVFLPQGTLFAPLLAAPRWPHFSGSYQLYTKGINQLKNVGAANFGETFTLLRFDDFFQSRMEIGIQAGVFSVFDLDAPSNDLINADYYIAIPLVIAKGRFAGMTRIAHQSSHLGDEFILRGRVEERINLEYEQVDILLSYELPGGFRVYGGGGFLFDQTPADLDPWSTQAGVEFRNPNPWFGDNFRLVAALDIQNIQKNGWDTDLSLRAGAQLVNADIAGRTITILLEYYHGNSPNGQFFNDKIEYISIGTHLYCGQDSP